MQSDMITLGLTIAIVLTIPALFLLVRWMINYKGE